MDGEYGQYKYRGNMSIKNIRRNGNSLEEKIIDRQRDVQRQWKDSRILTARYNKKYKE